jgi:hypothetical protein
MQCIQQSLYPDRDIADTITELVVVLPGEMAIRSRAFYPTKVAMGTIATESVPIMGLPGSTHGDGLDTAP